MSSKNLDDIQILVNSPFFEESRDFVKYTKNSILQQEAINLGEENVLKSNKNELILDTLIKTENIEKHPGSKKYLKYFQNFIIQNISIIILLILISILGIQLISLGQDENQIIKSIKNEVLQVFQSEMEAMKNISDNQNQDLTNAIKLEIQEKLSEKTQNKDLTDYVDLSAFYESSEFIKCRADGNGREPIHCACKLGRVDIVQKLIKNEISINIKDNNGWSPLHYACEFGHLNTVKFLIDLNASINDQTKYGDTCLIQSVEHGHNSIVEYLCSKNANVNIKNNINLNAMDKAIYKNYHGMIEILKKYGA